jgi:hypothetical protein
MGKRVSEILGEFFFRMAVIMHNQTESSWPYCTQSDVFIATRSVGELNFGLGDLHGLTD